MGKYKPEDRKLCDLLQDIDNGKLRLPCFQREYKWKPSKVIRLLDTIQNDHPAGTLLFIGVDNNNPSIPAEGFKVVHEDKLTNDAEFLVLDGQQRLTSCYCAFYNPPKGNKTYYINYFKLMELDKNGDTSEIDFEQLIEAKAYNAYPASELDKGYLPLSFLKNRAVLTEELKPYRNSIKNNPQKEAVYEFLTERWELYLGPIFDYEFPIVNLPKNLSLEAVCKVFQTINSTGLKLSAFDICVAKFMRYGLEYNIKDKVKDAKKNDKNVEIALSDEETIILQTIALLAGKPVKKSKLADELDKSDIDNYWNLAVKGLSEAINLLDDFGVGSKKDLSLLPYQPILPIFSALLINVDYSNLHITKQSVIREKMRKFFFITAIINRYTEGTDNKTKDDYISLKNWIELDIEPKILKGGILWNTEKYISVTKQSAFGKAVLCLLNKQPITDFYIADMKVGVGNEKEASQLHHIFPERQYGDAFPMFKDSVFNLTFLTASANNFINNKKTTEYISSIMQTRGLSEEGMRDVLKQHFISGETYDYLYNEMFINFLQKRANEIKGKWESMGMIFDDVDKNYIDSKVDDADLTEESVE